MSNFFDFSTQNNEFILTEENYYSRESDEIFLSATQFKDFVGTYGRPGCEYCAVAKITGDYAPQPTTAMLIGSYVDAYYSGTLEEFKAQHPECYKRDGSLKADFIKAEAIIERTKRDKLFRTYMDGEKQVIMTAEMFGASWKIKMDSYHPGKAIVDLKVMQSLTKLGYVPDIGYLDFIRYWGYDIQGAIYQEVVYRNTGERLPFYIAGASKEDSIDIEVIYVPDNFLRDALSIVRANTPRVLAVKAGEVEPERCGVCEYCRENKVLEKPIGLLDLTAKL